ncbi:MAG: 4,5-DOPA dioxygenase extradiol [Flavobacteriales bacterium]|nr:4,5-DOPA dioxygenase extradiol [Flavobacteriales bacterium]
MDRRKALQLMSIAPLGAAFGLRELGRAVADLPSTPPLPVLFLGHGSPMNAIEDNEFSRGWQGIGKDLPRPHAILCISAHWETRGTFVTGMEKPRTIHDFGGFPQALFDVQYPAPGSPTLAERTQQAVTSTHIGIDHQWGLDHGAWSVIIHLFPKADVPVVQLSLDRSLSPQQHYELARELAVLRRKGVLIIGSGNMVHNLGVIDWRNPEGGYDWAIEANSRMKELIMNEGHAQLADYTRQGKAFQLSIPTPEHYLPLLYVLGLKDRKEPVCLFNDRTVMGSIAMTSVKVG